MSLDLSEYGIRQRYAEIRELAENIIERCQHEVDRLGPGKRRLRLQQPSQARYTLQQDPASGDYTLMGTWFDERGARQGSLVFHADGSFFVEHDVVEPHPQKPRWFVEAVNAWGRGDTIKAELRLLPMPR